MASPDLLGEIRNMALDDRREAGKGNKKIKPLSPKEIVERLDASNRQKFEFEYERRARDQSTKWQNLWEAHLLVLTIIREIPSVPTLSPYPYVAVCRWEPAKEYIVGEGDGEFKLVLCDEVGAHFCVISSRIVNAEFYAEKNRQIFSDLQREILSAKVDSNLQEFKEKYPWAASRTIAIGVSDEHPFIAGAFRSARRNHLLFRQRQFQLAYLARFEKSRRGVLKKEIEMNDRHAIALRINAAISGNTFVPERSRKRLSHRGVRQWIEGIDVGQRWEGEESGAGGLYNTNFNSSVTALKM